MYHLAILREDEYAELLRNRKDEQCAKQVATEAKYCYSKEKEVEILKKRDLPSELRSLKRRKTCVVSALWLLSAVFGFGCGYMLQNGQGKKALACETVSVSAAIFMGLKWRSYLHKIRMKNEEIICAKRGWINPRIELYRQEGRSYC